MGYVVSPPGPTDKMGRVQPKLGSSIQEEAEQNQQELVIPQGHLSYDPQEKEVRRSGRNR